MKKELSIGKILIAVLLMLTASLCAYMGVMAVKKSLTIKMQSRFFPSVLCEIELMRNGESRFTPIFSNATENGYIAPGISLNEKTSTFTLENSFNGGLGVGFFVKVHNYTETRLLVETTGSGVSYRNIALESYNSSATADYDTLIIASITGDFTLKFTQVYQVSLNTVELGFNPENSTLIKSGEHYYQPIGIDLVGEFNECPTPFKFNSMEIGSTAYNYTQVRELYNNDKIITIPASQVNNDIEMNLSLISGYTELEYIQSTGTQYINTGYDDADKLAVSCDFEIVTIISNDYLFGSQQNDISGRGWWVYNGLYVKTTGDTLLEYNWVAINFADSTRVVMSQSISGTTNTIIINGATYSPSIGTSDGTRMLFFACYDATSNLRLCQSHLRCYYFKMVDNGTLVRDYIPMLRSNDSKPGMYDLVTNEFYVNQGTGDDFAYPA